MTGAERAHRGATTLMSLAMVAIGVALVVQAAGGGGSVLRVVLGALFVAAGVGRIYLLRSRSRGAAGEGEQG